MEKLQCRTFAYVRVSTWSQDILKDKEQLRIYAKTHNLSEPIFYEDHESGAKSWKERQIFNIIQEAKKGDVIIVTEISRLARALSGVLEIMQECSEKGIWILTVKEGIRIDGTMGGEFSGQLFAMMANIERRLLKARTDDARAIRAARNLQEGLPAGVGKSKLDGPKDKIISRLVNGEPKSEIAKDYNTSVNNLNTFLNKRGLNNVIEEKMREKMIKLGNKK